MGPREDRATVSIPELNRERGNAVGVESGIPFLHQDVSSEEDWERGVSGVERRQGALHVPVNNAGIQGHPEAPKDPENAPLAH
jgi:NAD(P)-dependent dehydrogenase (short-subunit alcohol dehydrogenase family)